MAKAGLQPLVACKTFTKRAFYTRTYFFQKSGKWTLKYVMNCWSLQFFLTNPTWMVTFRILNAYQWSRLGYCERDCLPHRLTGGDIHSKRWKVSLLDYYYLNEVCSHFWNDSIYSGSSILSSVIQRLVKLGMLMNNTKWEEIVRLCPWTNTTPVSRGWKPSW